MDGDVGEVLGVGPGVKLSVSAGDTVLYSRYSSSDVEAPQGEVTFVAESSIIAKLSS